MEWNPVETMPIAGEFLIRVWEGDWEKPRKTFKAYEACGSKYGPYWAKITGLWRYSRLLDGLKNLHHQRQKES